MNTIVEKFEAYLSGAGVKNWNEVYAGIAADARDRLFNGHGVGEKTDVWIYEDAGTSQAARAIEQLLLQKGAKGGPGGGDGDTRFVYAYKITARTRE